MVIKCVSCGISLKFDETKYIKKKSVTLKCPKCNTRNKVLLNEAQKHIDHEGTVDKLKKTRNFSEEPKTLVDQDLQTHKSVYKSDDQVIGWLVLHTENVKPVVYELYKGSNMVGRFTEEGKVDVAIHNDSYASRKHCLIQADYSGGQWLYVLSDQSSTNGTYLNTEKLKKYDQLYLTDGDTIQVGRTKLVFKSMRESDNVSDAAKTVLDSDYEKTIVD